MFTTRLITKKLSLRLLLALLLAASAGSVMAPPKKATSPINMDETRTIAILTTDGVEGAIPQWYKGPLSGLPAHIKSKVDQGRSEENYDLNDPKSILSKALIRQQYTDEQRKFLYTEIQKVLHPEETVQPVVASTEDEKTGFVATASRILEHFKSIGKSDPAAAGGGNDDHAEEDKELFAAADAIRSGGGDGLASLLQQQTAAKSVIAAKEEDATSGDLALVAAFGGNGNESASSAPSSASGDEDEDDQEMFPANGDTTHLQSLFPSDKAAAADSETGSNMMQRLQDTAASSMVVPDDEHAPIVEDEVLENEEGDGNGEHHEEIVPAPAATSLPDAGGGGEEMPEVVKKGLSEEDAAIKIQAVVRGYQLRARQIATLLAAKQKLEARVAELEEELQNGDETNAGAIRALTTQLASTKEQLEQLTQELAQVKSQAKSDIERAAGLANQRIQQNEQEAALQLAAAAKDLQDAVEQIKSLRAENATKQLALETAQRELSAAKEEAERLQQEADRARQALLEAATKEGGKQATEQLKGLLEEADRLAIAAEAEVTRLTGEVARLTAAKADAERQSREHAATIARLDGELNQARNAQAQAVREKGEAEAAKRDAEADRQAAIATATRTITGERDQLKLEVARLDSELKIEVNKVNDFPNQLATAQTTAKAEGKKEALDERLAKVTAAEELATLIALQVEIAAIDGEGNKTRTEPIAQRIQEVREGIRKNRIQELEKTLKTTKDKFVNKDAQFLSSDFLTALTSNCVENKVNWLRVAALGGGVWFLVAFGAWKHSEAPLREFVKTPALWKVGLNNLIGKFGVHLFVGLTVAEALAIIGALTGAYYSSEMNAEGAQAFAAFKGALGDHAQNQHDLVNTINTQADAEYATFRVDYPTFLVF